MNAIETPTENSGEMRPSLGAATPGMTGALDSSATSKPGNIPAPEDVRVPARVGNRIWKGIVFVWKYIIGAITTQNFPASILLTGWSYRVAQREIVKSWWKASNARQELSFGDFARSSAQTKEHIHWPNWLVQPNRGFFAAWRQPGLLRKLRRALKALFWSFGKNLKLGVQGIFNTWVLTLPGCALWLFAWYDGWNNSFSKYYEQAAVGPSLWITGAILFIAAMYYLPMAQIRQASTGKWRSFYEFSLVWTVIREKWLACLGLALLYALFSLPLTILKIVPYFFTQINPGLEQATPARALEIARAYYFWCGFVAFPLVVYLRIVAARIYASGLLASIQSGVLAEDTLAENEWESLHRLDLLKFRSQRPRHAFIRAMTSLGTRAGRAAVGLALFLVWTSFILQILVAEFMNKSEHGRGWLNQPLVQLPWFNYTPEALRNAGQDR